MLFTYEYEFYLQIFVADFHMSNEKYQYLSIDVT